MTMSQRILDYLKAHGASRSRDVAAGLGLDRRATTKSLSEMRRLGMTARCEGLPVRYVYVRDPVSVEDRLRLAREAYRLVRPPRDKAATLEKARAYRLANRERITELRRLRYAKAKAAKPKPEKIPRIPKPKPVKPEQVRVKPSRRVKEDGAFLPAAMIAPATDKRALPTSDDFLRAGGVIERLPSFLDRRAA